METKKKAKEMAGADPSEMDSKNADSRYNFWKGDVFRTARIALIVAAALLAASLVISIPIGYLLPGLEIGRSIVRDINILLISTLATLFGLYITAFIFLNDSLKNREKDDPTIKEAVGIILTRYRINMVWVAIGTIAAIVLEVVCNIVLGSPDGDIPIEDLRLSLNDPLWYAFIISTVCAIFILCWIILASRDIINGDHLIERQAEGNLTHHQKEIVKLYDKLEQACQETPGESGKKAEGVKTEFDKMSGEDILSGFASKEYTEGIAYRSVRRALQEIDALNEDELQKKFALDLGKTVRFIEQIISRVCDNNIDKSVMNQDYVYESMQSGFEYLYTRNATQENVLDVRDFYRFLDHLKYQIITDKRFAERPFDNSEVEDAFERAKSSFEALGSFGDKQNYISKYKEMMKKLIGKFFDGYQHLIGYRDALVHYDRYRRARRMRKKQDANAAEVSEAMRKKKGATAKDAERKILKFAEVYKRILMDRFMSFVKLNDLNLGNSTMDKGWFNYSELSNSNFTHSSFRFARLENAILRDSDLSTCSFVLADASDTDFSNSNFSYSDLTGMDLTDSILNHAQMSSVVLRDARIDTYYGGLGSLLQGDGKMVANVKECKQWHWWFAKKAINKVHPTAPPEKEYELWCDWFKENAVGQLESAPELRPQDRAEEEALKGAYHDAKKGKGAKDILDGVIGNFNETDKEIRKQQDELYNGSRLAPDAPFGFEITDEAGGCVLDECTRAVTVLLDDFINYRKFNKIGIDTFEKVSEARKQESAENKQERENKSGKICFGIARLYAASLNDVSMEQIDFSHVNMELASFRDSDLSDSEMYYTKARSAMFQRTNLNGIDAYASDFSGGNFAEASLVGAILTDCNFNQCNFKRAILLNSIIINEFDRTGGKNPLYMARYLCRKPHHSTMQRWLERVEDEEKNEKGERNVRIENIDRDHNFKECEFKEVLANNLIVMNANMIRSRFWKTSMRKGFFYNVLLRWCSFKDADFSNSVFIGTSFHQSNLENAIVARARFFACDFGNATLNGADMISTSLEKVIFDEANLNGCNLASSHIRNCTFNKCSFRGTIFDNGTVFENCVFSGYDFRQTIGLTEVKFLHCVFEDDNNVDHGEELELSKEENVRLHRDELPERKEEDEPDERKKKDEPDEMEKRLAQLKYYST